MNGKDNVEQELADVKAENKELGDTCQKLYRERDVAKAENVRLTTELKSAKENTEHLKTWHSNVEAHRLKLAIEIDRLRAVIEMHEKIGELAIANIENELKEYENHVRNHID